jgi:hypothetical protein
MKIYFYLLVPIWLLGGAQMDSAQTKAPHAPQAKFSCLPAAITPDTIVEAKQVKWRGGIRLTKETVVQRLGKLKARCKGGKLLDQRGKEIRFHTLQGCWGNPPADYLEIQEAEKNTLRDLRKKFTVIEITCNPAGILPISFLQRRAFGAPKCVEGASTLSIA